MRRRELVATRLRSGESASCCTVWLSSAAARASSGRQLTAPERMIGDVAIGVAEVHAIGIQRGAERASRIARRGRHEHAFESRLRQDPRVARPFNATPPPKHRSDSPVSRWRARAMSTACPRARAARSRRSQRSAGLDGLEVDRLVRRASGPNRSTNFDEYDRLAVV